MALVKLTHINDIITERMLLSVKQILMNKPVFLDLFIGAADIKDKKEAKKEDAAKNDA